MSTTSRICTTHVGSLSRPDRLIEMNRRRVAGEIDDQELAGVLRESVADVVRRQAEIGIDVVNDGEFGKLTTAAVDYGPWMTYAYGRLDGWEETDVPPFTLAMRDNDRFADFYATEVFPTLASGGSTHRAMTATFTGPVSYRGHDAINRDLENLRSAVAGASATDGFVTSIAPASIARGLDPHYGSRREFLFATAEALREEYKAIIDAGFVLQIDDPSISDGWGIAPPEVTMDAYLEGVKLSLEAANHALEGLPRERTRFHCCWGSWHGPHTTDIPLADFVDLLLDVNVGAFSVEASNVRHELDWQVWRDIEVPEHLTLIPGVVSHATNLIETPELVAERIMRYAEVVGREHVMAGTDCGLGGRIHPELAWAKLEALVEGARLASERLW
jgi:5-methyltetrahydropteroyltriglutamate--homocysteine methyltransferase